VSGTQVDATPPASALAGLRAVAAPANSKPNPAGARAMDEPPGLWARDPPIRYRAKIPTAWLEITLREGKNRQVRRMTARVGFPTLRLVRAPPRGLGVGGLAPRARGGGGAGGPGGGARARRGAGCEGGCG